MVDDPSAALLIRVWLEGPGELRARLLTVRAAAEVPAEETTVAVASSPDDVLAAVRAWLDGFVRDAVDPGAGNG